MVLLKILRLLGLCIQKYNQYYISMLSICNKITIRKSIPGFILPFTMLISVLVLLVTSTSLTLLSKQFYFSKIYRQSQTAFYAADDAIACALILDDTYVGGDGLGIFPSDSVIDPDTYISGVLNDVNTKRLDADPTATPVTTTNIKCGQAAIFDRPSSGFGVSSAPYEYHYTNPNTQLPAIELGRTSTTTMRMDLGGGAFRCAKLTINKTASFRQIIAQGYAKCDDPNGSVERAVVNTTITN